MEKDCELIFEGKSEPYKFRARDLDLALKWAKDSNAPVLAVRTPWFTLSVMDDETYNRAVEAFHDN